MNIRELPVYAIRVLATVRNKRGVGHAGGDVSPNHMDSQFVLAGAKWVLAELVRLFHGLSVQEAGRIVEAVTVREVPIVWDAGRVRRVLRTMSKRDASLLLLLSEHPAALSADTLVRWVEHSNPTVYRKQVLHRLHTERLVEFDELTRTVALSPTGVLAAEALLRASNGHKT